MEKQLKMIASSLWKAEKTSTHWNYNSLNAHDNLPQSESYVVRIHKHYSTCVKPAKPLMEITSTVQFICNITLWQLAPVCFISDAQLNLTQWFCVSNCDTVLMSASLVHLSELKHEITSLTSVNTSTSIRLIDSCRSAEAPPTGEQRHRRRQRSNQTLCFKTFRKLSKSNIPKQLVLSCVEW